jgi:prolyl 4-hydroxylase
MNITKILFICLLSIIFFVLLYFFLYANFSLFFSLHPHFTRDGDYYIKEIPNFLTKDECNKIMELSQSRLIKSTVYTSNSDIEDKSVRISKQCWLTDLDDPFLVHLSKRIAQVTGTDVVSQEDLQIVKYDEGGFYKPHYDACNKETDDCARLNKGLGPRYITFIMYLNDDFQGGETFFPNIQTKIKPELGKAAIFYNVDNDGEILPKSLHGGLDVRGGSKWIANKWIRYTALADKY